MEITAPEIIKTKSIQIRAIWAVLRIAGPVVLSAVVGWGSVQFSQGTTTTRITNVESEVKSNKQERIVETTSIRDKMLTRDEFKTFSESLRSDIGEIKTDVREIRSAQLNSFSRAAK